MRKCFTRLRGPRRCRFPLGGKSRAATVPKAQGGNTGAHDDEGDCRRRGAGDRGCRLVWYKTAHWVVPDAEQFKNLDSYTFMLAMGDGLACPNDMVTKESSTRRREIGSPARALHAHARTRTKSWTTPPCKAAPMAPVGAKKSASIMGRGWPTSSFSGSTANSVPARYGREFGTGLKKPATISGAGS